MNIGEIINYKGYDISHPVKEDYITEIAHDSLADAKRWIDRLLQMGEIESVGKKPLKVKE